MKAVRENEVIIFRILTAHKSSLILILKIIVQNITLEEGGLSLKNDTMYLNEIRHQHQHKHQHRLKILLFLLHLEGASSIVRTIMIIDAFRSEWLKCLHLNSNDHFIFSDKILPIKK